MSDETILIVDGSHGIYVPQVFAQRYVNSPNVHGIDEQEFNILLAGPNGPDPDLYWETWDDVLANCVIELPDGRYGLWPDGDLFMYRLDTPDAGEQFL